MNKAAVLSHVMYDKQVRNCFSLVTRADDFYWKGCLAGEATAKARYK